MKCAKCKEEEKFQLKPAGHAGRDLQMKPDGLTAPHALSSKLDSSKGSGQPLPEMVNAERGNKLDTDFSGSVDMKVTPDWSFGVDRYSFEFLKWDIQAFDCYNWDPVKSEPFVGNDEELCCLQNDGRGKHYLIQTDQWANTHPSKHTGKIFIF